MHANNKNRSRCYQMMLKSLKVLPNTAITASTVNDFVSDKKGKCKATNDGDGLQTKKKVVDYEDSEYGEEENSSGRNDCHVMQVSDD